MNGSNADFTAPPSSLKAAEEKQRIKERGVLMKVRVESIREAAEPQRSYVDAEALTELANSIREKGLLQPIGVVSSKDGNYDIIWGSRRLSAVKQIGDTEIDAFVFEDLSPLEVGILRIAENMHTEGLFAFDEENDVYKLWQDWRVHRAKYNGETVDFAQSSLARELGISNSKVNRIINHARTRLGDLSPEVQNASPTDLQETVGIAQYTEARHLLLRSKQSEEGVLGARSLRTAAQAVATAPVEYKTRLAKLIVDGKVDPGQGMQNSPAIEVAKTLKKVPPDVQEMLLNQEVDPKTAMKISRYSSADARKKFKEELDAQAQVPERQPKLEEADKEKIAWDREMVTTLSRIRLETKSSIRTDFIEQISDVDKREKAIQHLKEINDTTRTVLEELGQL